MGSINWRHKNLFFNNKEKEETEKAKKEKAKEKIQKEKESAIKEALKLLKKNKIDVKKALEE